MKKKIIIIKKKTMLDKMNAARRNDVVNGPIFINTDMPSQSLTVCVDEHDYVVSLLHYS